MLFHDSAHAATSSLAFDARGASTSTGSPCTGQEGSNESIYARSEVRPRSLQTRYRRQTHLTVFLQSFASPDLKVQASVDTESADPTCGGERLSRRGREGGGEKGAPRKGGVGVRAGGAPEGCVETQVGAGAWRRV